MYAGGNAGYWLTGNNLFQNITGGGGNDTLDGGGAPAGFGIKERLSGYQGNDLYILDPNVAEVYEDPLDVADWDTIRLQNTTVKEYTLENLFEELQAGIGTGS